MIYSLCRSDGNAFTSAAAPSPAPPGPSLQPSPPGSTTQPTPFFQGGPAQSPPRSRPATPGQKPGKQAISPPSTQQDPHTQKKTQSSKTKRIVGISIASVLGFIILTLALLLCVPWCFTRSKKYYQISKRHEIQPYLGAREDQLNYSGPLPLPSTPIEESKPL